ncbi:hypothetical protein BDR07DRAFT_1481485 [Suillus spraguei]|nr:hypothetical protein BDR07DRAFT_1481485 [Suillus spraguei]
MDSTIKHVHAVQFAEPLGAFMEMDVDSPVSPSLESTDHDHLDFGLISRPRYEDDVDFVCDDESELDFGLHPSGAITESSIEKVDTKPLDLGTSISPPVLSIHVHSSNHDASDSDSMLDDGSGALPIVHFLLVLKDVSNAELNFGLQPSDTTTESPVGAVDTEPLVMGISISPPPLSMPVPSSNLDVSDGDRNSVLDDESELDFGLYSNGAMTESSIWAMDTEPLDLSTSISPPVPSIHIHSSNHDVSDSDSMLDDGSELDFGLHPSDATTESSVGAMDTGAQLTSPSQNISMRSSEPLVLGISISPPPLFMPVPSSNSDVSDGDHNSVLDDESELDFGLHPSGSSVQAEDVTSLDLGVPLTVPLDADLGSDHAHRSSKYVAGPSSSVGVEPPVGALPPSGGLAQYTPTRYGHLPAWASQSSLLPAVNEFNTKYRRRETLSFADWEPELLSLPGAPTDDPIPAAADLYEFLARDAGKARSSYSGGMGARDLSAASGHVQPPRESSSSSENEDLDIPLSEEELLKLSRSVLTLNRLNAVTTGYAHRLVNEVADGDEEQVHPTLQDILEAERPFHVAYLETTESFRKTLHNLQRAVRMHDQTLQLQAQLDAMIAAVEGQEQVFR